MILATLGKLSVAQALTDADPVSDNIIQIPASDYIAMADAWWVVTTIVAAATAGTIKIELRMATSTALSSYVQVACVDIAAITDKRVATLNRHVVALNLGKTLVQMLDDDGSTYPFIGIKYTLSASTTITVDAAISPTEPWSEYHKMVTESPVGVPAIASAGSGL